MFFELIRIAIGRQERLCTTPTAEEWEEAYDLAQRQTLTGIAFCGVQRLPEEQRPPRQLLMKWYMAAEQIRRKNEKMDRVTLAVANKFAEEGFPGVVLKGQGVAKLYRVELSTVNSQQSTVNSQQSTVNSQRSTLSSASTLGAYRTPGDIDIWLYGERKDILRYVRRHVPDCKPVYHHVDFPVIDGLPIEVHFTPSWMNSPCTNRRLQEWFRVNENVNDDDDESTAVGCNDNDDVNQQSMTAINQRPGGAINRAKHFNRSNASLTSTAGAPILPTPSLAFNRVYILVHIYRHLFHEGIGLRQLLDYYFVLHQGFTEEERAESMRTLRSLRMERFTAAVMWVLQEVFALEDRYLLTAPNEEEGHFLLSEIMLAGNFGHYDVRIKRSAKVTEWRLFRRRVGRNLRFLRSYPSEVLWAPFFKLWHTVFRLCSRATVKG